jgi:pimeloyl-ACP methyl ester carboxylesterase
LGACVFPAAPTDAAAPGRAAALRRSRPQYVAIRFTRAGQRLKIAAATDAECPVRTLLKTCLVAACLAASAPEASDATPTAPRERRIDVGGYRLNVAELGRAAPAVVFVSGLGEDHDSWSKVQAPVAEFARTLAYDRGGLGRSDPTDRPRDVASLAAELHALLGAARLAPPYVMVGHSLGGAIVRVYAARHPGEIAGLVLVDPEDSRLTTALQARLSAAAWRDREAALAAAMPGMPAAVRAERVASERSGAAVLDAGELPQVPLVLLTGTLKNPDFPGNPLEQDLKLEIQAHDLARVRGARHILVPQSRHYIQSDAPQLVVDAVREVLRAARGRRRGRSVPAGA